MQGNSRTNNWKMIGALALAAIVGLLLAAGATRDKEEHSEERYMFIWAGDQARTAPDFLTVVDFDERHDKYGKVITTVPLPGPGASGNEPHHVGLSSNGRVLGTGGLLSVLKGQPEVFFWDVSDPSRPKFLSAADPPNSAITDEFHPLPDGGFLVTMMGSASGGHPGRVAEFDSHLKLIAEHPKEPPADGFNPHGISVRPEMNLMVTSDFICPSTTLHAMPGPLGLHGGVRVWDLKHRTIVRSVKVGNDPGTIDVQLIPQDPMGRAFTAGMTDDKLYLIDTRHGLAESVFDFSSIATGGWPQLMRMTRDGRRMFISMNVAGKVAMLDTSDLQHPHLLKALDLGANAGPHYIALTHDERRLVVTDYFLNEDAAGKVHAEGDHKVHVLRVSNNDIEIDRRFQLDFNSEFRSGPARPHGVAFK